MTPVVRDEPYPRSLPSDASQCASRSATPLEAMIRFPRTRYQGSKRRLAGAIVSELRDLSYDTVLDAFGGTGSVAYAFKSMGKSVTYNDLLRFNHQIGLALIENDRVQLDPEFAARLGEPRPGLRYDDFIARTFRGIYFTDEENLWLDRAAANLETLEDDYARAMAWFCVFQAAMAKRPYNLFHRCNLYMRTARVARGFGNKATWERSFSEHVRRYATEANRAILDANGACRAIRRDVFDLAPDFDLVYLDPPYVNARGVGVDYRAFYHFLEGLTHYRQWSDLLDHASRHKRLRPVTSPWIDPDRNGQALSALFDHFRNSLIVVSYRSDGLPRADELIRRLGEVKRRVRLIEGWIHQYALSTNRRSRELLILGLD